MSRTTAVGEPVSVPLTCTDHDDDELTLSIVDGPTKGSLGPISGDAVTYTPDAGEFGADTFTYRASDGTAQSATGDGVDHDHAAAGLRGRLAHDGGRRAGLGAADVHRRGR